MRDGMVSIAAVPSMRRSAEIIASGSWVSSAAPASARNSRERDSASRMSTENPHEIGDHRQRDEDDDDRAAAALARRSESRCCRGE